MESAQPKPTTMSENARAAAKVVAAEQQKREGRKVLVVALADGYDGFKFRQEGERFYAWWPKDAKHPVDVTTGKRLERPSWQMEASEFDKLQRAAAKAASETGDVLE